LYLQSKAFALQLQKYKNEFNHACLRVGRNGHEEAMNNVILSETKDLEILRSE
jgi:hypothetical protein